MVTRERICTIRCKDDQIIYIDKITDQHGFVKDVWWEVNAADYGTYQTFASAYFEASAKACKLIEKSLYSSDRI